VVLCAASDYEALKVHQSWRVLADRLAEARLPTLRFDYPGSGNSLDDGASFEAKLASIRHATRFLMEKAGVSSVTLIGLRLGAALALETAVGQSAVDCIVLVRPVVRGKAYFLEQKALARILAKQKYSGIICESEDGRIEIEGFTLDRDEADAITKIDLLSHYELMARRILIACEPKTSQYNALEARLIELGGLVSKLELSEVAAWVPSAIPTPPPLVDIDSIIEWVREGSHPRQAHSVVSNSMETETFVEIGVQFGETEALRGVLCRPKTKAKGYEREAVLFLNAGGNYHIGPGRTTVEYARHLASQGVASLRMDCVGIGDSAWRIEGPLAAIHHEERVVDVSRAIDELERAGLDNVSVAGLCSGAFLAFRSALKDPRVKRVILADPHFWLPLSKEQLADPTQGIYAQAPSTYLKKTVNLKTWQRMLRGKIRVRPVISFGRQTVERMAKILLQFSWGQTQFSKYGDQRSELERELANLGARGCQTLLVFSGSDPMGGALAREIFATHMGTVDMMRLPKGFTIETVEGADHSFVNRKARREFRRLLTEFVIDLDGSLRADVQAPSKNPSLEAAE
jgi:pimeloyl-ACP methyl ester carboxylesterase